MIPSGEWFGVDDLIAAVIGGIVNLAVNAFQGNINSWGDGFAAFGAGAAAGALSLYGPAGWAAGGAIVGGTNAYLGGATSFADIAQGALIGAVSGLAGGAAGQYAAKNLGNALINGFNVTSPVVKGIIGGSIGGAAGGYAGGFTGGLIMTGDINSAHKAGINGLASGAAIGAGAGGVGAYASAKANGINPWNGKHLDYPANGGAVEGSVKKVLLDPGTKIDRYGDDGRYASPFEVSIEQRSLSPRTDTSLYRSYEVIKPLSAYKSISAPYYFKSGGGVQYKFSLKVNLLVNKGYLRPLGN